jgi:hypothetical protein
MKHVATLLLTLIALGWGAALADPNDLSDGVLICHCPPGLAYTVTPTDWCATYREHAIHSCVDQVNRIDVKTGFIWYVVSAWSDSDKTWCGVEFGLGQYDPSIWAITAFGPCGSPEEPLQIPTDGWPGPGQGTAIATLGKPWSGNYLPIYYFAGYAYYPGVIPLGPHPKGGFVGWANCEQPAKPFLTVCLGSLGLFQDGRACCPPPPLLTVCCFGAECRLMPADQCRKSGGIALPMLESCGEPDACSVLRNTLWDAIRAMYR